MYCLFVKSDGINLNLGCGIVYKPGYVNIDCFDHSVADLICNAIDLPFKSNSIDIIQAYHLIEHFDYIHCKYVLSEWFIILKPDGMLILETPDLDRSFKKFSAISLEKQKSMLQWIYGIDSPGMQHKTGFTFKILKTLLKEIGFDEISKRKATTHKYEPGLRIECKKPKDYISRQLFATFRKELKKKLSIDDSDMLISLENYCLTQMENIYYKEFDKNKEKTVKNIIAKCAICNPLISSIFCEKCIEFGFLDKDEQNETMDLIRYLIEIDFHKKLLTLWSKSKKTIGKTNADFLSFVKRLESLILTMLDSESDYRERLRYIANLKPTEVDIFNFHVIQLKARVLFNMGIRRFHKKEHDNSLELFLSSVKLNPEQTLAYWNLARLGFILKDEDEMIKEHYQKALSTAKDKKIYMSIKKELESFKDKRIDSIPREPISEYI